MNKSVVVELFSCKFVARISIVVLCVCFFFSLAKAQNDQSPIIKVPTECHFKVTIKKSTFMGFSSDMVEELEFDAPVTSAWQHANGNQGDENLADLLDATQIEFTYRVDLEDLPSRYKSLSTASSYSVDLTLLKLKPSNKLGFRAHLLDHYSFFQKVQLSSGLELKNLKNLDASMQVEAVEKIEKTSLDLLNNYQSKMSTSIIDVEQDYLKQYSEAEAEQQIMQFEIVSKDDPFLPVDHFVVINASCLMPFINID
ncbi:MAG: hypothetical protein R3A45_00600 [Bdellovibrionota bacterium]